MRKTRFLSTFVVFAALLLFANVANAGLVEVNGSKLITLHSNKNFPLSTTASGDYAFSSNKKSEVLASFKGYIPSNSMITFTYSSENSRPSLLGLEAVQAFGEYHYKDENNNMLLGAQNVLEVYNGIGSNISAEYKIGNQIVENPGLLFVTAQFVDNIQSQATVVIKNLSAGSLFFETSFLQFFSKYVGGTVNVHYEVSAVPLPAALPLFGLGLAGMAGVRSRRKAKKAL